MKTMLKVPLEKVVLFEKRIANWNKKIVEMGLTELKLSKGKELVQTKKESNLFSIQVKVVEYWVEGNILEWGDWEMVGSVHHPEKGASIVSNVPGYRIPQEFYFHSNTCDHCGTQRARNFTFIVRNIQNGQYKRVGGSCLNEFMAFQHSSFFMKFLQMVENPSKWVKEEFGEPEFVRVYSVEYLVALAYAAIARAGKFIPAKLPNSTYHTVMEQAHSPTPDEIEDIHFEKARMAVEYMEQMEAAYNKASNEEKESYTSFDLNMMTIFRMKFIECKPGNDIEIKIAVAFPSYYEKKMSAKPSADFVGKKGDTLEISVTIQNAFPVQTMGMYNGMKYIAINNEGEQFVWIYSGKAYDLNIGDKVFIKGKVKDHQMYGRQKQTLLSYVKVV